MRKLIAPGVILAAALLAAGPAAAAIAKVADVGTGSVNAGTQFTIASTVTVPVGDTVLLAIVSDVVVASSNPVVDAAGNTWVLDNSVTAFLPYVYCYRAVVTNQITVGQLITVSLIGSGAAAGTATEFSGIMTSSPIDGIGSATSSGLTQINWSTSNATTTQSGNMLFGYVGHRSGATATAGASWTGLPAANAVSGFTYVISPEYLLGAGVASYPAYGSFNAVQVWNAGIQGYRAALVPVELQRLSAE